ncbi:hypothetical protein EXM22_10825 [Oceanispirochaeta crateris]|jgi:hypothetical protein|uniref:Uncharacterized protein n=1 Tax=Oceanispirochaeta crateris TaxID=2518645 RepID=A0A5C1QPF1_9SPIO|nr:hypothetical protein [Oceanispirochaeta crateris]QEN08454.1 hypothetical protein EXM22_10825 [Oceanispirochaeta crateris]
MTDTELLIGRAVVVFFASFLAIWVWSRTREESWLFIISGILVSFVTLLIEILMDVGILTFFSSRGNLPLWFGILQLLPYVLYAVGLAFYLYRNRQY